MKRLPRTILMILAFSASIVFSKTVTAQDDKSKRPSPPAEVSQNVDGTTITINYSQPGVKDREIWGGLVPYGKIWRTGANEATTFEVSNNVEIEGKSLKAGKYALFTIPEKEDDWTVIFNSVPEQWGAYNYDEEKDVLRVKAKSSKSSKFHERMTFNISKNGKVSLLWENLEVAFNVK